MFGRLPRFIAYHLAAFLARITYRLNSPVRRAVLANMRRVLGPEAPDDEVDGAARRVFRSVAYYYVDLFRMPHMSLRQLGEDRVLAHGLEHVRDAVAAGRGVVMCTAHYGNPEFALQAMAYHGIQVLALTEVLSPAPLNEFVHRIRAVHGHRFLPLGFDTLKETILALRKAGVVAVMFDRDIRGRSIVIDLCGSPASVPTGTIDLALRTGAVVIPCFSSRRVDGRFLVQVGPPMELSQTGDREKDTRANVEALFALFLPWLRQDPAQWMVTESIWDTDP